MKKFDKIYVDMDGVIANFDGLFKDLIGSSPHEYESQHGTEMFWDAILEHRNFFADIKPYDHIHELINICHHMSDNVVILSSPSKYNTSICIEQKRNWLDEQGHRHLPATFEKEKHKFARENCLLIDDWEKNINKWVQAGGVAHHFKDYDSFLKFYDKWKKDV